MKSAANDIDGTPTRGWGQIKIYRPVIPARFIV
jgi:hypothetical protein